MAAHTHVVSHMLATADHPVHFDTLAENHRHIHLDSEPFDTESLTNNCAMYHAYAGMSGLSAVNCDFIAVQTRHLPRIQLRNLAVNVEIAETQPIRGPPALS